MEPRRGALTRLRILKAARVELARHGYAGCSLAVIAAAAGLRKPSIFAHFDTKDELYGSVVDDVMRELTAAIEEAAPTATSPTAVARAIEKLYAGDSAGARVLVRELFDQLAPRFHVRERMQDLLAGMCARFPEMDAHLALSFVGMHLLWWASLDPAHHAVPPEHGARLLA